MSETLSYQEPQNVTTVDNLTPEVITARTTLGFGITTGDDSSTVSSTKGFPDQYGLLKIGDEIIVTNGKGLKWRGTISSINIKNLKAIKSDAKLIPCLLYTSPSPRDRTRERMPSSA
mgnify:CR=1 FL=1